MTSHRVDRELLPIRPPRLSPRTLEQAGPGQHSTSGARRRHAGGTHGHTPTDICMHSSWDLHTLTHMHTAPCRQAPALLVEPGTAATQMQHMHVTCSQGQAHPCNRSLLDAQDSHTCQYHLTPRHTEASLCHTLHTAQMDMVRAEGQWDAHGECPS